MSYLQKVEKRGARWACNSTRRIRDWEVQSGGHTTTYLGVLVVNWCGEGDLRGWIMTPRYRRKPSVSIGQKQLRLRQAGRRCRRSGWRASVGDASPCCRLNPCSQLLWRTVFCSRHLKLTEAITAEPNKKNNLLQEICRGQQDPHGGAACRTWRGEHRDRRCA